MAKVIFTGQICLSDIPKEVMREYNGKIWVSMAIIERREVSPRGETAFISVAPRREEREDGQNYIIGNIKPYEVAPVAPTAEQLNNAPHAQSVPWE